MRPLTVAAIPLLLILTGCGCGDRAATRHLTIVEARGPYSVGAFDVDTSQLPPGAVEELHERQDGCGEPYTLLRLSPDRPVKIIIVPATKPSIDRETALRTAERTVRSKVKWEPVLRNATRNAGRWQFLFTSTDNVIGSHALLTVYDDGTVGFTPGL